jgi:hypothetical protein
MGDDQLDDLKQFIETTVGQSETRIKDELRQEFQHGLGDIKSELRQEIRDGFAAVSDAIDSIHDVLDNHETRITSLEQKAV